MEYNRHQLRVLRRAIGKNIHNFRTQQQIPLHKLARITCIPEMTIDYYELGKCQIIFDDLFRIACALDVDVKKLMN